METWAAEAEIRESIFIPHQGLNNLPPIGPPSRSFSTSLVCPEIRFGRRLFYGQDALRGIWKGRFKGDGWSEGREREWESLVITALRLHLKLSLPVSPRAEMNKRGNAEM